MAAAERRDEGGDHRAGKAPRRPPSGDLRRARIGLTDFYNQLDDGAWREIADLHRDLDRAVARAYGWPASIADDRLEIRARLAELHRGIESGAVAYRPFADLVAERLLEALSGLRPEAEVGVTVVGGRKVEGTRPELRGRDFVLEAVAGPVTIPVEEVRDVFTWIRGERPE